MALAGQCLAPHQPVFADRCDRNSSGNNQSHKNPFFENKQTVTALQDAEQHSPSPIFKTNWFLFLKACIGQFLGAVSFPNSIFENCFRSSAAAFRYPHRQDLRSCRGGEKYPRI
ncbi:hypothetical protein H3S90_03945 [Bartonella sp. W8097]|uniref:hypothetical protein n=1 Tax=Bartonella apihabitans TaxID=2750929 RepID=UPI0018DEA60A|nr:hypothetical protein [Bartonella apihabitans]MBI0020237.1 hypothetical protein [Bartonella apihabitans]